MTHVRHYWHTALQRLRRISAWLSYSRAGIPTPVPVSLLCCKPHTSALFKKNNLKTQKREKNIFGDPKELLVS